MPRLATAVLGLILTLGTAPAAARTLRVGPGDPFARPCAAITVARPGDTVTIDARGNRFYRGDVCAWSTRDLTIMGVHGQAHIDAAGRNSQGKAIWYSHNLYINHVASFTFRDSWSYDARVGHLLKSRAARNYILFSRLTGQGGTDSYELDLPNGGLSYVIGDIIQQGARTQNPNMLAYGEEGDLNPDSHLYAVNDTFVNGLGRGAAVLVGSAVTAPVLAENDLSTGSPSFVTQAAAVRRGDCLTAHPDFVHPAHFDYRLRPGSRCRGVGRPPGRAQGYALAPRFQYLSASALAPRTDGGRIAGALGTG